MNFFKLGVRILSKSFPLLLAAGGVALVLALLPERRGGLRSGAVKVTKGALITKDKVKDAAAKVSAGASAIIKEARQARKVSACRSGGDDRANGRRMAVTATKKILTLKEKAQAEFKSIVEEAKRRRAMR